MSEPLLDHARNDGNQNEAPLDPAVTASSAAKPATVWKPVIFRVVLGGLALLGLAGVGAASMLAGLDGARANPPSAMPATSSSASDTAALGSASAPLPAASAPPAPVALAPNACTAGRTPDGKVILNLATLDDLRTLPSIGPKRAQAILSLRDKLKKFHRIQELRRVRGIGAKTLQKLAMKILIDPPPGSCAPPASDAAKGSPSPQPAN
jgi:competence protein ComEA